MKTTRLFLSSLASLLVLVAALALPRLADAAVATNWIAFNDHRPTTNTSPNATGWEMGHFGNTNGPLRDFVTGAELEALLYTTFTPGSAGQLPDDFGQCRDPNPGTPAFNLFDGIVDIGRLVVDDPYGDGITGMRADQGTAITLVFTNLNPTQRYLFRGTSVRGNNYVNRWAYYTILGADSFVDAHVVDPGTNNLITRASFPSATLVAGQVALNSGENRAGSLVGWNEIDPGPDGSFSILEQQYVGPTPYGNTTVTANAPYGYGLNAMMLVEVGSPLPAIIVTQPPASLTVLEQRPIKLTVLAQGAPLPAYQWYKGTEPIPGATRRAYTITNAVLGDSGEYYVVVSNPQSTVTSSSTIVTVLKDEFSPVVLGLSGAVSGATTLTIQYDEALDPATGLDPYNYKLNGVGPPNEPTFDPADPSKVVVTFASPIESCVQNRLEISDVKDLFNNTIVSTTVVFTASLRLMAPGDGQPWRFDQSGIDRGTDWFAPGYNDSGWTAGTQLFDAKTPTRTALPNGVAVSTMLQLTNGSSSFTTNNLPTSYLRTHFNLPTAAGTVTHLRGRLLLDDGAILYLNGVEAYRQGVRADIYFADYCNGSVGDADYQAVELSRGSLREGDNVLAVELKNNAVASSDLTFGLELIADVTSCATSVSLAIALSGGQAVLSWPASATGYVLEQTAALANPSSSTVWTEVGITPTVVDGRNTVTVAAGPATKVFRLRQ